MSALLQKLLASRRFEIKAGGFTFDAIRPTDADAVGMQYGSMRAAISDTARFIIGWRGVRNCDVLPGEDEQPAAFSEDLYRAWVMDQPELWDALVDGLLDKYTSYRAEREEAVKP